MSNLDKAIDLAAKLGHVFVATADSAGMPHVAAAAQIRKSGQEDVTVSAWFCPGTMANLENNQHISLVIWDPAADKGYQLLGEMVDVAEQAMMNGYSMETEKNAPLPQVERKLIVRILKILAFSHAPHSDVEE